MNILILYNSSQTYTNTVFEHLAGFREYSGHRFYFAHADPYSTLSVDLSMFDAVGIHFSVRLPFDQVSQSVEQSLSAFKGLKFLFIQDEYDFPHRTWHWIRTLDINLVFTVVPDAGIEKVYPKAEFPNTRFVTNLTGYVPEKLPVIEHLPTPSQRTLVIGYRGRPLPIRYGQLAVEKVLIGEIVRQYCDDHGVNSDIAWEEKSRIYGPQWYEFIASCRSMLATESGSNVFDWDGTLGKVIADYRLHNSDANDDDVYRDIIRPREVDGLMNQVSPKIFETIALRSVLVLYEGNYSGVVRPGEHYIALKKDGSNLQDVMRQLNDAQTVDAIAERAWNHVIGSGRFSQRTFVEMVDRELEQSLRELSQRGKKQNASTAAIKTSQSQQELLALAVGLNEITTDPVRAGIPRPSTDTLINTIQGATNGRNLGKRLAIYVWLKLPEAVRSALRRPLKQILGSG